MNPDILPGTVINGADGKMYIYSGATWKPLPLEGWGSMEKPKMSEDEYRRVLETMKPTPAEVAKAIEGSMRVQQEAEDEKERLRLRDELRAAQS